MVIRELVENHFPTNGNRLNFFVVWCANYWENGNIMRNTGNIQFARLTCMTGGVSVEAVHDQRKNWVPRRVWVLSFSVPGCIWVLSNQMCPGPPFLGTQMHLGTQFLGTQYTTNQMTIILSVSIRAEHLGTEKLFFNWSWLSSTDWGGVFFYKKHYYSRLSFWTKLHIVPSIKHF